MSDRRRVYFVKRHGWWRWAIMWKWHDAHVEPNGASAWYGYTRALWSKTEALRIAQACQHAYNAALSQ